MKTKIVSGVVVSQPVVLNFKGVARVLILVNVEGRNKKFCYSISEQDTVNMSESSMVKTIFANIALSAVGDKVYVGFLNEEISFPIILGKIYQGLTEEARTYAILDSLKVDGKIMLSSDIQIGELSYKDLENLVIGSKSQ